MNSIDVGIKDILAVIPAVIIVPVFPFSQPDPFKLNFLTLTFESIGIILTCAIMQ